MFMNNKISYEAAGVDIDAADELKRGLAGTVSARGLAHCRPLNKLGAFASFVDLNISAYRDPVFVLKSEEPGSKQMLSMDNDRVEWIARDLINHLVNDIIVTGAIPCAVLDTVICGKINKDVLLRLINAISEACAENDCVLVGGETSEQPGVLPAGRYILQASILGIAERDMLIDGSAVKSGDALLALASNGLHTNGYSLVRKLMEEKPAICAETLCGVGFMDSILKPHTSYARAVAAVLASRRADVRAMAHITGGGMRDNLIRVLPTGNLRAEIDLASIRPPKIFGLIKSYAGVDDAEMLRTFNNGVGMIMVVDSQAADDIALILREAGTEAYRIGSIARGTRDVAFHDALVY